MRHHFGMMSQVEGVCRGIMQMLGSLTGEYAELLTRLAVKQEPLELGQQLHVGQSSCSDKQRQGVNKIKQNKIKQNKLK